MGHPKSVVDKNRKNVWLTTKTLVSDLKGVS